MSTLFKKKLIVSFLLFWGIGIINCFSHPFLFIESTKLILTQEAKVIWIETKYSFMGPWALVIRGDADKNRDLKLTIKEYSEYLQKNKNFLEKTFTLVHPENGKLLSEKLFFTPDSLLKDISDPMQRDSLLVIVYKRKYLFSQKVGLLQFKVSSLKLPQIGSSPMYPVLSIHSDIPIVSYHLGVLKNKYNLENITLVPQLENKLITIKLDVSSLKKTNKVSQKISVPSNPYSSSNRLVSYLVDKNKFLWIGLIVAFFLGLFHAFTPGHGKTIVAFYMSGENVTLLDALILAFTVTFTHVISVFILGFLTLWLSDYFLPQKLFPVLEKVSAGIILGVGIFLLFRRITGVFQKKKETYPHSHTHTHADEHSHAHSHPHIHTDEHSHAHSHPHIHTDEHVHTHPHTHAHADGHTHSHGENLSEEEHALYHLKEYQEIVQKEGMLGKLFSLLGIGISGGILPCPSAFVVLLVAISVGKISEGILLLLSFSLGLGVTLSSVAILFYYIGNKARKKMTDFGFSESGISSFLGIFSATVITGLGVFMFFFK
jgi:ABC-type nickel/cobalt efflux system permease component RcnA